MSVVVRESFTIVGLLSWLLAGCSGLLPTSKPAASAPASDPTPLAKCKVGASSSSPLVTEWPASEKAHLQGLAASRTVAVEYSGCELHIVDACALPGSYFWQRTSLATDTLEIADADELYAKLPIGAVGLEGELARSGRLSVRTAVAGQLRNDGMSGVPEDQPSCKRATHYIGAISVGAFQLLSGNDARAGGKVDTGLLGPEAQGSSSRRESVVRAAGDQATCSEANDEAPHSQCAAPIQLFLIPLAPPKEERSSRRADASDASGAPSAPSSTGAVNVTFPPPSDEDETWTLRAPGGRLICRLPCDAWVGPVSGYYLQRETRGGAAPAEVRLPPALPHPLGSRVTAEFQVERGNPTLSRWTFYAGIPTGLLGVGITSWGIVQAAGGCEEDAQGECFPGPGFLIGAGVFYLAMAGGATWWYLYSQEERFTTYEKLERQSRETSAPGVKVMVLPGAVVGQF